MTQEPVYEVIGHSDGNPLMRANYDVATEVLDYEDIASSLEDAIENNKKYFRTNTYCGRCWCTALCALEGSEFYEKYKEYPCFDEEKYSEYEWGEIEEYVDRHFLDDLRDLYRKRLFKDSQVVVLFEEFLEELEQDDDHLASFIREFYEDHECIFHDGNGPCLNEDNAFDIANSLFREWWKKQKVEK